jgi:hypothetical protein
LKYKITESWKFRDMVTEYPWDFNKDKYCSVKAAEKAMTKLRIEDCEFSLKEIMDETIVRKQGAFFEIVPHEI